MATHERMLEDPMGPLKVTQVRSDFSWITAQDAFEISRINNTPRTLFGVAASGIVTGIATMTAENIREVIRACKAALTEAGEASE